MKMTKMKLKSKCEKCEKLIECNKCKHLVMEGNIKKVLIISDHFSSSYSYYCPSCKPPYDTEDFRGQYMSYYITKERIKCDEQGQVKLSDLKKIIDVIYDKTDF